MSSPSPRAMLGVFLVALVVYNANFRRITSPDCLPARLLPFAILTTGSLDFDRMKAALPDDPARRYGVRPSLSGHLVSTYPIVVPLLVTPLYVPAALYASRTGFEGMPFEALAAGMEKLSASVVAAASAVLVFVLLRRFATPADARLLTAAYAFGTGTWVIGSQALWAHGTAELLLAALLILVLGVERDGSVAPAFLAGLVAGLLVVNRPPDVPFALAAAVLVALTGDPRRIGAFLVPAAAVGGLTGLWNLATFGHVLGGFAWVEAPGTFEASGERVGGGLAGMLVSPGRGLLVFSPFLLFLAASVRATAPPELRRLLLAFVPAAAAHLLIYGTFFGWTGGTAYGLRFLVDMSPVLVLALVPALGRLSRHGRATFAGLVGLAVFVQAVGAFCYPSGGTNRDFDVWDPTNVQWVAELRGGPALPSILDVALCRGLGYESLPWREECRFESE